MSAKLSQRRQKAEAEQAEDYAAAIRNSGWITPSWKALNEQIIEEFGRAGLLRIKRRAWQIVEHTAPPEREPGATSWSPLARDRHDGGAV